MMQLMLEIFCEKLVDDGNCAVLSVGVVLIMAFLVFMTIRVCIIHKLMTADTI